MTLVPQSPPPPPPRRRYVQVTSRRHPLAVGVIAACFLIGLLFLLGVTATLPVSEAMKEPYRSLWAATMTLGALSALVGMFWPAVLPGLLVECAGLSALALMNLVYTTVLMTSSNPTITGPRGILFAVLAFMFLVRAVQCEMERSRIWKSADQPEPGFGDGA